MFQLYGSTVSGCVFVVPAVYIEWRGRVPAKAGGDQGKAKHLYRTGRDLDDGGAAATAGGDLGSGCGGAAGWGGGFVAEPV